MPGTGSGYDPAMSSAPSLDPSAIPEDQREAVLAVLHERDALRQANKRLEHLVAGLNQVVHGKKSERLIEDERQLAFEGAPMERQWSERHWRAKPPSPRSRRGRTKRPRPVRGDPRSHGATEAICPRTSPGSSR